MAYISAEDTRAIARKLKETFRNTKFSVRNDNHTAIRVRILSAPAAFVFDDDGKPAGEAQINHYHLNNMGYRHVPVLQKIVDIINSAGSRPNYDKSDSMVDYFDVGYYVSLSQGAWNKPFKIVKPKGKK